MTGEKNKKITTQEALNYLEKLFENYHGPTGMVNLLKDGELNDETIDFSELKFYQDECIPSQ